MAQLKLLVGPILWEACPFRATVPEYITIQLLEPAGFSLYSAKHDLSVDSSIFLGPGRDFSAARDVLPMVKTLAAACFDQEYPDELLRLIERRAALGKKGLPPDMVDQAIWLRYKELGAEISAS